MTTKYKISIDVPDMQAGIDFYSALGFERYLQPVTGYVILKSGEFTLGLLEKPAGSKPALGSEDVRKYERHWTPVHADFHVQNFEETLEKIISAGAIVERKFEAGEHSRLAFCSDPFGNGFVW
ncbi:glyoxalase [Candidatus Gracilibacteria bacterium]|nr:glyoxalase [Candidatus Gracilibacteria bacterium]